MWLNRHYISGLLRLIHSYAYLTLFGVLLCGAFFPTLKCTVSQFVLRQSKTPAALHLDQKLITGAGELVVI
jgi:hypothetical protein